MGKRKLKVMSVFGTRPEAIKMCPLVKQLQNHPDIESIVCLTGQHKQMLAQVIQVVGIEPDYDLQIMRHSQTLTSITCEILQGMEKVLAEAMPDVVLVHGDTSTSFAAALAAFYRQIPVGHVEAGLRTFIPDSPFPEEMNRCLTGKLASIHFAPTAQNAGNLEREGITRNVFVTGNTVIDAFQTTVCENYAYRSPELSFLGSCTGRVILLTAHRRENLGAPLESICRAVLRLIREVPDIHVVFPVHLSPAVRKTVYSHLADTDRLHLIEPLDVADMHNLIAGSYLVLTDSGGLQEEAPACGVPVLVLRTETERPEAVATGTVRVVGIDEDDIFREAFRLLTDPQEYSAMARRATPYGDGQASARIVRHLLDVMGNRT